MKMLTRFFDAIALLIVGLLVAGIGLWLWILFICHIAYCKGN
jgi:hypothetical protein